MHILEGTLLPLIVDLVVEQALDVDIHFRLCLRRCWCYSDLQTIIYHDLDWLSV